MLEFFNRNKQDIFIIFAITLFAFIIRLISLLNFGDMWVDELFSLYFASQKSPVDIFKILYREDFHVPFYFICLHYWTKLFGNSPEVLRLMGCLFSTFSVPVCYIFMKNMFNRFAGISSALFLAISAFNIHYSVEVRFYGISVFFAICSAYFFVKYIQDFKFKNIVYYSIFTILLLYTYNFAFMYIFCQFVIGGIYLFKFNKQSFLKFFLLYIIIALIYSPVIIMIFSNAIRYNTTILKFVRDIFTFDITWYITYLITVFSNIFDQFMTNEPALNYIYIKHIFSLKMIFFVLIPVCLGIYGLFFALKEKNKNIILFLTPAILLFLIQSILVLTYSLALIYRYTIITTTILLIVSVLGYSFKISVQNKKYYASIMLILWFILNLTCLFKFDDYAVMNRKIIYTQNLQKCVDSLNIQKDDYILIPRFSKLISMFVTEGIKFDIDIYDAFFLGIKNDNIEFIFGKDLSEKLNRKMAKTLLYKYIAYDKYLNFLDKNLYDLYFSKMKKGQRFIIITDETLKNLDENQKYLQNLYIYSRSAVYDTLSSKILKDILISANMHLKYQKEIIVNPIFTIYVFEK